MRKMAMMISEDMLRRIIREELQALVGLQIVPPLPVATEGKSPGQIALEMARAGDVEGSKAYLRSLSGGHNKRRRA